MSSKIMFVFRRSSQRWPIRILLKFNTYIFEISHSNCWKYQSLFLTAWRKQATGTGCDTADSNDLSESVSEAFAGTTRFAFWIKNADVCTYVRYLFIKLSLYFMSRLLLFAAITFMFFLTVDLNNFIPYLKWINWYGCCDITAHILTIALQRNIGR